MRKLLRFLNPLAYLGVKQYTILFPFAASVLICVLSEFYAHVIAGNPEVIGSYIILIHITSIIYFAFRNGIPGGLTATVVALAYYFYIIKTQDYTGQRLTSSIVTTIELGIIYFVISLAIGHLKQKIDRMIFREAEEKRRLQVIIDQLPVGVIVTDHQGKILHQNKQIKTLLTRTEQNEGVSLQGPLNKSLETGASMSKREFVVHRSDGKKSYLQISATPIRNSEGHIIAAASIISDITAQKDLESKKDDFVNMASHELKTPITSMRLYIESLLSTKTPHTSRQGHKTLKRVHYQIEKLQEIVSDLLDVSRIQTGKLLLHKERFLLNDLVRETVKELQSSTIKHVLRYESHASITLTADKFRIYQVLTNLITNAVKYSPDGGKILIRLNRKNGQSLLSVEDHGIGIDQTQHKKIFERLYQVTDRTEKTFPGLGMGLYISKEIIKRHKGDIWVESQKGKGSTFYVSMPIGS